MKKNIPLLPFWLSLVLIVIAIALPTGSINAAPKKHTSKHAAVAKRTAHSSKKYASKHSSKRSRKVASKCNRVLGKQQALTLINSNGQLCRLAGLSSAEEIPTKATTIGSPAEVSIQTQNANYTADTEDYLPEEGEDLAELEQEDNVTVDIEAFKSLWLSYIDGGTPGDQEDMLACGVDKKKIMDAIMDWVGTRYIFGGTSRSGIDCSSFTRTVFASAGNFLLPRTAAEQSEVGTKIRSREKMQFGDIVFFHTRKRVYVSHVGIYLGDNLFAHASSRYGVTVSSLESDYYNKRLIGVKRLQHVDVTRYALEGGAKLGTVQAIATE